MFHRTITLSIVPTSMWNDVLRNKAATASKMKARWFPQTKEQIAKFKPDAKGTIKQHKISSQDKDYVVSLFKYAREMKKDETFEIYHKMKKSVSDVRVMNALIKVCNQPGMIGEAFAVYNDLKHVGLKPNMATFSTLTKVCVTNEHIERGMYVLKEFLSRAPVKNTSGVFGLFQDLLKLSYKMNLPGRAFYMFSVMKERGMVKELDIEFVSRFVPHAVKAEKFLYAMKKQENPNFVRSTLVDDLFSGFKHSKSNGGPNTLEMEMDVMTKNLHRFQLETGNKALDEWYDNTWGTICKNAMAPVSLSEGPYPLDTKDLLDLRVGNLKEILNSFGDEKKIDAVLLDFVNKRTKMINHLKSNSGWKAVIFTPHDTVPFYPSNLSINLVTEKTVKQAKMEYLDTVQDLDIKDEIVKDLNERITIHWLDENGELIEGVKH